ncbi:hypothetical protein B0H19DRAFT_1260483 [Mycena capillaripes]|nr:hypothetical protein B0H19DRAFT_1260483 [Mycena capillaripes]
MHHCLTIPEIVDMICFHLDPRLSENARLDTPRNLGMMARTCRSLQGPALDHLWSSASLGTLLTRCMPSDLWAVDVDNSVYTGRTRKLRLLRPIRASDWDRVRFYTPRVKRLISGSIDWSLSGIFPALSVSFPETSFSCLHDLRWHHSYTDFYYIHLFLRPTLTSIYFTLSSDDSSLSFLSILGSKCPKLTEISIAGHYESHSISEFVSGLQYIEKISAHSLDGDALLHLSQLTTLESLTLNKFPRELILMPMETQSFPSLRTFSLAYPEIRETTQFLGICSAIPLKTFDLNLQDFPTAHETHVLFAAIATGFSSATLTFLSIENEYEPWEELNLTTYQIPRRSLQLLCRFHNLAVLVIMSPLGFTVDNADVSDLARAWPRIVTLRLSARTHTYQPCTTLACLPSFAQHCPRLCNLHLALDCTTVPPPVTNSQPGILPHHSLESLHVEHSPIASPIAVARFLSYLFPNVRSISTVREHEDNEDEDELDEHRDAIRNHGRWKEVVELLPEVLAIREEGRMLAIRASAVA